MDANSVHHNTGYLETDPTGRYGRFEEVLGRGATKIVYKAIDELLGMEVAWSQVKLNHLLHSPDELQRLYSEVHLLSTLNHDSVIQFYTSWIDVDKKSFNFITEMFTSGTLREYRKRYQRIDIQAIKCWARQILRGLAYLHGQSPPVIHRDIKCDNIFVNGHLGEVKIGDLGLAAILHGSQSAHSVIGTPEFMAPELYEEEYNELVDVYSFGMCVLEMLTSEYPYGECTNPAQIYKKVTSGKLPAAFYQIQDPEARRFIKKCLQPASTRLPAKDLLLDPFLAGPADYQRGILGMPRMRNQRPLLNTIAGGIDNLYLARIGGDADLARTDMTITGKLNSSEEDALFLKVQITNNEGSVRNIYFSFDTSTDTPLSVAKEMVRELDITDWDPVEIADMIDGEVSALIPQWKGWGISPCEPYHTYNFQDDDDGPYHMSHSFSSCSSSQASVPRFSMPQKTNKAAHYDSLVDDASEDTSSQYSMHSRPHLNLNSNSSNELESDMNLTRRNQQPLQKASTRFCPEEYHASRSMAQNCRCKLRENRKLTRNHSFVDVRSQLVHHSLVEEVNKRRLFRTVGAVENIGFQAPFEISRKNSSWLGAGASLRTMRDNKGNIHQRKQ